jgi:beta-N-acetylhexosaminidase
VLVTAIGAFAAGVAVAAVGENGESRRAAADRLPNPLLAGQRIVFGFDGTEVPRAARRMIRDGKAAGVILFADNFPSRAAGRSLIRRLQSIPRPAGVRDPLLIMTDQEGGLVKRLSGAPTASAEQMGEAGPAFSREQGRRTARNLRDVGVTVDLAPVLDVAREGGDIEETDRGFGSTPARVKKTGVAFANALQRAGVAATAKHFPGFGAADENTDFAVERIGRSRRTLRRVDEAPYERFIAVDGGLVMLSNAIYPAFSDRPAVFTRSIATRELRVLLGFRGVSITDALGAVAAREFGGPEKASVAAAKAGVDLALFTDWQSASRAYRALRSKLRSGDLDRVRFKRSVQRVLALRHELE